MRYWIVQVARALSRLLNAVTGGEGDSTFSAWSYHLMLRNKRTGKWRVKFVDSLFFNKPGHCKEAYEWHTERRLLERD
jgi:hypothetical protein